MFKEVDPKESFSSRDEKLIKFWKENKIFEKSVESRPLDKSYSFYDGPPFITGLPHYATLLPSIAKDLIPRFKTMQGYRVRRVWGWDCHGLPAETQVEKELGLKGKPEIEALGVGKFVEACRTYVTNVSEQWGWYIDHIGRWVDFENAYKTMDLPYMESVMWAFKEFYSKGLIYEGYRTSLYCPRCATPLSKFEITMDPGNYKDREDTSVIIKFKLKNEENKYILAWTTTPWTLPANLALAVDVSSDYVEVADDAGTRYILGQGLFEKDALGVFKNLKVQKNFKGSALVNLAYEPLYDFFTNETSVNSNNYQVYGADFVSLEEGVGVVHIAPSFGEEDFNFGKTNGLSVLQLLDDTGHYIKNISQFGGFYYEKANAAVLKDLEERGSVFSSFKVTHSYPHCYRCGTPLIYKSQNAWYVNISELKNALLSLNEGINWVPEYFKEGRFKYNLENAPDWCISRSRYWGSPVPVWKCKCGEVFVPGSISELEEASGQKVTDLHRPEIDEISVKCKKCGGKASRVPEVLDCWMESGAMPFAQFHYPFQNQEEFKKSFPADFIIEYTGQLRGWFYYLHVLGVALFKNIAFKNVAVTGVLYGDDGRKMSKSFGNYPDPKAVIEKYGGESLRLYFMGSPIMAGEDMSISETDIADTSRRTLLILWNSYKYFVTYANANTFDSKKTVASENILDFWLKSRLESFIKEYTALLNVYDIAGATRLVRPFVDELSTWYIRLSRDRFAEGDLSALGTLYEFFKRFSLVIAPLLPFTAEAIYKNLTDVESVHVEYWPEVKETLINPDLEAKMRIIKEVVEVGRADRKLKDIKLRQPLQTAFVTAPEALEEALITLIKQELNVKDVELTTSPTVTVSFDVKMTPELLLEGNLRDFVRTFQDLRKAKGLEKSDKVRAIYVDNSENNAVVQHFTEEIQLKIGAVKLDPGAENSITKLDGE